MANDDDSRSKKDAVAADEPNDLGVLFNGTPEEKVRAWLHMFQDEATDVSNQTIITNPPPPSPISHLPYHIYLPNRFA